MDKQKEERDRVNQALREGKSITHTTAKQVLWEMYRTGREAIDIIEEQGLWEIK